jgi:hypothetical protein
MRFKDSKAATIAAILTALAIAIPVAAQVAPPQWQVASTTVTPVRLVNVAAGGAFTPNTGTLTITASGGGVSSVTGTNGNTCSPTTGAVVCQPSYGTTASKVAQGNDSRFNPTPSTAGALVVDTGTGYTIGPACGLNTIPHGAGAAAYTCSAIVQADVSNGYVDLSSAQSSIGGAKTFTANMTTANVLPGGSSNTIGGSTAKYATLWGQQYGSTEQVLTGSGAVAAFDPTAGSIIVFTATNNVASLTMSTTGAQPGQFVYLVLRQGGGAFTWPTTIGNVKMPGGSFTKTSAAASIDTFILYLSPIVGAWLATPLLANLS